MSLSRGLIVTTLIAAVALAASGVMLPATRAVAAAPMVWTQAPGFYRMRLGDFEVTVINDGTISLDADKLLAEPPAKTDAALKRAFETSPVGLSDQHRRQARSIDTGAGALLGPTLGKFLVNLRAAGYRPEQIDDVFLTHMHPDHVGGLMASGALAFPNATIHASRRDSDYWLSQANLDHAPSDAKGYFQGAMASLGPYIAAGKYRPFDHDSELVPGVRAIATPGHTAGHTSYLVESRGQKLMLIGDLIHVAAVQFNDPGVTIAFDSDAPAAAATRMKMFAELASDGDLIGANHLAFPALGRLHASGKSWQWVPVNYSTQLR